MTTAGGRDNGAGSPSAAMDAFGEWADVNEETRNQEFREYVTSIAHARFVMRKVLRIVNQEAKEAGLEPLQHQALLQIYGSDGDLIPVHWVSARLDVAPAFASRLTKQLEDMGLVQRTPSTTDRRVIGLSATPEGVERLRQIDHAVHREIAYFQGEIEERERAAALAIFAFYVGLPRESELGEVIRRSLQEAPPGSPPPSVS